MPSWDTSPAVDAKEYTSFASDIDLSSTSESKAGRAAKNIRVVTAGGGALTVVFADGTQRAFTALTDGEDLTHQVKTIKSGATVSKIRVEW